jgi:hypothetical protein
MTSDQSTTEPGPPAELPETEGASYVQAPKLMRIASMTRAMLEEIRQAPMDDAGRRRMAEIHEHSLEELQDVLSDDLRAEVNALFEPLSDDSVSEAEIRAAQAQLVGWLEGLFAGIQASLWSQHAAAADQLQQMRMRAIEAEPSDGHGQYL